jgi:hypothetical protein
MAKHAQKIKVTRENMQQYLTDADISALATKARKHHWCISDTELDTMAKMFAYEAKHPYADAEDEKQSASVRARILYYLEDLNFHAEAEKIEGGENP